MFSGTWFLFTPTLKMLFLGTFSRYFEVAAVEIFDERIIRSTLKKRDVPEFILSLV